MHAACRELSVQYKHMHRTMTGSRRGMPSQLHLPLHDPVYNTINNQVHAVIEKACFHALKKF